MFLICPDKDGKPSRHGIVVGSVDIERVDAGFVERAQKSEAGQYPGWIVQAAHAYRLQAAESQTGQPGLPGVEPFEISQDEGGRRHLVGAKQLIIAPDGSTRDIELEFIVDEESNRAVVEPRRNKHDH